MQSQWLTVSLKMDLTRKHQVPDPVYEVDIEAKGRSLVTPR